MAAVAAGIYDAFIQWNRATSTYFTLDSSLLDGPDVLAPTGPGGVPITFDGTYDNLNAPLDPTWPRRVEQFTYFRGRSRALEFMEAGGCTIQVNDPKGLYNPDNAASPLYGLTSAPERPIRLRGRRDATWHGLHLGFLRDLHYEPKGRGGTLHVDGVDLFLLLDDSTFKPTITATGATTTGAAIGLIHDALGWTDPAYRDFDTGDSIPNFVGDGETGGVSLIEGLLAVEFGIYFVNGAGVATYNQRSARYSGSTAATISDVMRAIGPGVSLDQIINSASFTKTGSTAQVYTDATSADPLLGFGLRAAPDVTSPYIANDTAAHDRAHYRVALAKDPTGVGWQLAIDNRTSALLDDILALEIGNRVAADEAQTGTDGTFVIERLEGTVDVARRRHQISYLLSEAVDEPFTLT